jgi:glycine oxidase
MIAPQAEAQATGAFFALCLRARDRFAAIADTLAAESGIDPEFDRVGIVYIALDDVERADLQERARWQAAAGGTVEELSPDAARKLEPLISPATVYALHMPKDGRTDNRKLTQAYAAAAIRKGAHFVEGATIDSVIADNGQANGVILHDGQTHHGDFVVVAAGSWIGSIRGLEADAVATHPVRGQIVCFEARPGLIGPSVFSTRGYVVPRRDGRLLAGSTMEEAGYDKSVTLGGIEQIARGACEMLPSLEQLRFREAWAGLRPATRDFMPVLGASPSLPNVLYAAGHFRSGILLSALTGEILADLVAGRTPPLDLAPFSPARFSAVAKVRALGLVRDILFRSRIDATANALGIEVAYASDLAQARASAADLHPPLVFADLSDANFPAERTALELRGAANGIRLVGFASHVDLKSLNAARAAGFEITLSRSEFTARLAELLSK